MVKTAHRYNKPLAPDIPKPTTDFQFIIPVKKLLVPIPDRKETNKLDQWRRFHENIKNQRPHEQSS